MVWTTGATRDNAGILGRAAVFLAFPASPAAPPSEAAPVTATTVASAGLDGGDALAALFAGVAVGSLAFSHDMRRSRQGS